jgi:Fe-S cluster biogenesis protein NfuA
VSDDRLKKRVLEVLAELRPYLHEDGGDVELVGVELGVVSIRLLGACSGCPSAEITLYQGIAETLRKMIPEVEEVRAV